MVDSQYDYVVIVLDDDNELVGLVEETKRDSLLQYMAIVRPRTLGEAVIDLGNWTHYFSTLSAEEVIAQLPHTIKRLHGGRVPRINYERKADSGVGTSRRPNRKTDSGAFTDALAALFGKGGTG